MSKNIIKNIAGAPKTATSTISANGGPDSAFIKVECYHFLPVTAPAGWDHQQDTNSFIDKWGESDDYIRDTRERLNDNLNFLHTVLDEAIAYFVAERKSSHV